MVLKAMIYEADILCPYKWTKIDTKKPIWFTSHINELARDRDTLFRNYRRGGKKDNAIYQRAVEKRKEFNKLVKLSRDSFYKD